MNILITTVVVFVVVVLMIEVFSFVSRQSGVNRKKVQKRLKDITFDDYDTEHIDIYRKKNQAYATFIDIQLLKFSWGKKLNKLIYQANSGSTPGNVLIYTLILIFAGFTALLFFTRNIPVSFIISLFFGLFPYINLILKKNKRMRRFQEQLPDAMDLIARSLKAGHAFTSGMKLATEEFEDPIGPEFNETLNLINFGVSVPDALKNLSERVDSPDLRFFIISVILQRETGGNLAEIIENISHIVRGRFKLKDKIRTISAEGRLAAAMLTAIPILVIIVLFIINRDYITIFINHPTGRILGFITVTMVGLGIAVIRKMINIEE